MLMARCCLIIYLPRGALLGIQVTLNDFSSWESNSQTLHVFEIYQAMRGFSSRGSTTEISTIVPNYALLMPKIEQGPRYPDSLECPRSRLES